jgi:hypothetical protein
LTTPSHIDTDSERKAAAYSLAAETLQSLLNVMESVEEAGLVVLETAGQSTVKVVTSKYGGVTQFRDFVSGLRFWFVEEAGEVAQEGLSIGTDLFKTGFFDCVI